jgi:hypothetical protein
VAVGGKVKERTEDPPKNIATACVEALDLSTMRWSGAGCKPSLPDPRAYHQLSLAADRSVVVCSGFNRGAADPMDHLFGTALRWSPGGSEWASLVDLPERHQAPASVSLPDGRTLVIGGLVAGQQQAVASVLALAADGSGWSALAPMAQARWGAAAVLLPDGKVLVAGGQSTEQDDSALKTAELYDPATNAWTALPDMADKRTQACVCVLPSGRVAVLGGRGVDGLKRKDGEAFDPVTRTWEPLPEMLSKRANPAVVPVAGGMIVAGRETAELFDEESGWWLALPHPMAQPRGATQLVSLPASALQSALQAAAAAADAGH